MYLLLIAVVLIITMGFIIYKLWNERNDFEAWFEAVKEENQEVWQKYNKLKDKKAKK